MTAPNPPLQLLEAFDHQDDVFHSAFSILQEAIEQRAFPAASVAITHQGRLIALKTVGHFTYGETGDVDVNAGAPSLSRSLRQGGDPDFAVTPATLFDLASLTKIVATTPMAMLLYERGLLDLYAPISAIIPEFILDAAKDPRRNEVTIRMLLAHSSGLPAYEKLFLKANTREELLQAVFSMPLASNPATRAVYSDIGFILLGIALERLADEPLDRFCQREIFAPLSMTNTTFNPPAELRSKIPPTADEREDSCGADTLVRQTPALKVQPSGSQHSRSTFRHKIIRGEVQDENAYVLGGIAPHAGLFSTARDLAQFADSILNNHVGTAALGCPPGAARFYSPETLTLFTRRESTPKGTSRALGWDTPSGSPSQSGKYFSSNSFGHLGYTGTSLWIDPTRQLSITLLTNRTWPDCSNLAIKQVRPEFHDAVVEALAHPA
jgi:CubicO group peptidase (beta-lactamase class C family)